MQLFYSDCVPVMETYFIIRPAIRNYCVTQLFQTAFRFITLMGSQVRVAVCVYIRLAHLKPCS